jgi:hypothetical protein
MAQLQRDMNFHREMAEDNRVYRIRRFLSCLELLYIFELQIYKEKGGGERKKGKVSCGASQ